jgi:hypothetical protein
LNAGVSGFSTAEELAFLENEGIKYQPDVVILGFSKNDYQDNVTAGLFRLNEDGSLSVEKTEHIPGVRIQNLIYTIPMVPWLSENSYFYSYLFNSVWEFFKAKLRAEADAAVVEYVIPATEEVSNYQGQLAAAIIGRMHRYCRDRGIKLIIMGIPTNRGYPLFPTWIVEMMPHQSDAYIDGNSLLADYYGVAGLHVPHGSQHMSELSHAVLGVAAGKQIESWLAQGAGGRVVTSLPPAFE